MELLAKFNYWIYIVLMLIGLWGVIGKSNLIKRVIGLGIFQTAIFLFFISVGKLEGGTAPVRDSAHQAYSNPLPHALILTAIVVSVSITAVALAIIINIKRAYRTIEADEIDRMDSA
jgi:multicomponent Na+:H+ antiporter subunit C